MLVYQRVPYYKLNLEWLFFGKNEKIGSLNSEAFSKVSHDINWGWSNWQILMGPFFRGRTSIYELF
jgi:hypothetical protein